MSFAPARLRLARLFRDLTLEQLGERVAASTATLSNIERELRSPSSELVEALGAALGFERSFFETSQAELSHVQYSSFRSRKDTSERLRRSIEARAILLGDVVTYLRGRLRLPAFSVPEILVNSEHHVEGAAETCRRLWGLGVDAPIVLMSRVLERAGVVIATVDAGDERIDAYTGVGDVCVAILNTAKGSGSRQRFDMAHELGHIVMHRGSTRGEDSEKQADAFASAFLMPAAGFGRHFRSLPHVDWPGLLELKRHWGTSLAAIIRRAYDLGLIDAAQYRRLYKALSAKGWKRGEPQEPPQESPELVRIAFETLEKHHGETPWDVARALGFMPRTLEEIAGIAVKAPEPSSVGIVRLDQYRSRRRAAG